MATECQKTMSHLWLQLRSKIPLQSALFTQKHWIPTVSLPVQTAAGMKAILVAATLNARQMQILTCGHYKTQILYHIIRPTYFYPVESAP